MKLTRKPFYVTHTCYLTPDEEYIIHPGLDGTSDKIHCWCLFERSTKQTHYYKSFAAAKEALRDIMEDVSHD